jgi:CRP/FNR family transcriptional regulator, cyclic AMP receptor protein
VNLLNAAVQDRLRALPDVSRLPSLARCSSLYKQDQEADAVFLIDEGLVKLTRMNDAGAKIILTVCGPGQIVGEEALSEDAQRYYTEAVSITAVTLHRIPHKTITAALTTESGLGSALVSYLLNRKLALAEKVELLCLHDVEHRILHYLQELSALLPAGENGGGHNIPITQLELADLIGATRETTSTTLNQLERQGLLKLSRRLLTVPAPEALRKAADARILAVNTAANGASR